MNLSKGSDFDGVSLLFVRECADVLSEPLSVIFSRFMPDGKYPDLVKIGQITPIFNKNGQRNNVENYSGPNVLPNLAKVYERVAYNELKMIITPHISTSQHGCLSNRHIETNLIELTTHIFYADIRKEFDVVNPALLTRKMANFPMSNNILRFFVSYFDGR